MKHPEMPAELEELGEFFGNILKAIKLATTPNASVGFVHGVVQKLFASGSSEGSYWANYILNELAARIRKDKTDAFHKEANDLLESVRKVAADANARLAAEGERMRRDNDRAIEGNKSLDESNLSGERQPSCRP